MRKRIFQLFLIILIVDKATSSFFKYVPLKLTKQNVSKDQTELKKNLITALAKQKEEEEIPPFKTIKVTNYFNLQYYSNLYFGSQKTKLSVILDSGSDYLWVPQIDCKICRKYTNKYDHTLSNCSYIGNEKMNITYAKGFVKGTILEDQVALGTDVNAVKLDKFRFLLVNEEENLTGTVSDGVLGLGFNNEGNTRNTLVTSLYLNSVITKNMFSLYLSDSKYLSRIYLGDIFQNTYLKKLVTSNNDTKSCVVKTGSSYWMCQMTEISVETGNPTEIGENDNGTASESVGHFNKAFYNTNSSAIFDSGSSLIIMPEVDFLNLKAYLSSHNAPNETCSLTNDSMLQCHCQNGHDFGKLGLHFGKDDYFVINFKNIIQFFPNEEYQCHFDIIVSNKVPFWVLGDSALRGNLISFDYDDKKIQWTPIKTVLNEAKIIESSNVDTKSAIYYTWVIAGAAFLGLIIFLAYNFMK